MCQKTFEEAFAVTKRAVGVLIEKKKQGQTIYEENRGGPHHVTMTDKMKDEVRRHIESFPYEENHYSQQKSARCFLSPHLNVNRMHVAFKAKYPNTGVTYRCYDIFRKEYHHLRFWRPRSDTCGGCEPLQGKMNAATTQQEENAAQNSSSESWEGKRQDEGRHYRIAETKQQNTGSRHGPPAASFFAHPYS